MLKKIFFINSYDSSFDELEDFNGEFNPGKQYEAEGPEHDAADFDYFEDEHDFEYQEDHFHNDSFDDDDDLDDSGYDNDDYEEVRNDVWSNMDWDKD